MRRNLPSAYLRSDRLGIAEHRRRTLKLAPEVGFGAVFSFTIGGEPLRYSLLAILLTVGVSEIVWLPSQAIRKINSRAHQLAAPINFKVISQGWNPVSRNGNERATAVAIIEAINRIRAPFRF